MSIEVKFENLNKEVMLELAKARKSVFIVVAWISFGLYSDILKLLAARKVMIKVVCADSPSNYKPSNLIDELKSLGIEIVHYEMPNNSNYMHHKYAIIDERIIITGSFNWSKNAESSFENIMIIKDNLDLVSKFVKEYEQIISLNTSAIKSLQSIHNCQISNCNGNKVNILVFDGTPMKMTYEMWGDIVEVCSECNNYKLIENGIQDPSLNFKMNYDDSSIDEESSNLYNYLYTCQLDRYLTGYKVKGHLIHAIGIIVNEIISRDGDSQWITKIIWKNKFIEKYIEDYYNETFGVNYE